RYIGPLGTPALFSVLSVWNPPPSSGSTDHTSWPELQRRRYTMYRLSELNGSVFSSLPSFKAAWITQLFLSLLLLRRSTKSISPHVLSGPVAAGLLALNGCDACQASV